jgi:NAD(P)-dependent dehydrogenase (short-subunit alcohol dehydrogenase family)
MRMSEEDFDKVIDVNLKCIQYDQSDSENILKKRAGSIINMSSSGEIRVKPIMPLQKQVLLDLLNRWHLN